MTPVYLDNSATTPVDPHVLEAMLPFFTEIFGNASSIHTFGQRARAAVEEARERLAILIGASAKEIIFTSGGTESDNTAVRGVAYQLRGKGQHIITTRIEHPAILSTCKALEEEGFRVTYLPVDSTGLVDPRKLADEITPQTILITVMHANNEIGTLQPLAEICAVAHERGILVHSDCVQTLGKIPIDMKTFAVDLASFSGHKLHGPKGVGALYVRKQVQFKPLVVGGSHERKRRAGTENVPGIVGFGKAAELGLEHLPEMETHVKGLRDRLQRDLLQIPGTTLNGHPEFRAPHICNLSFDHTEGEGLLISLDLEGIAVSTGAACSSGSLEPSHVLIALGRDKHHVHGSLRFSLSRMNTEQDVDRAVEVLPQIVERMRSLSPSYSAD
ncbi:MAG: cysteine desulfurase NifS [Acidobacteria bacterium]|nr:cysteine desulfurase NifS [Acidobacteriota bacterium]